MKKTIRIWLVGLVIGFITMKCTNSVVSINKDKLTLTEFKEIHRQVIEDNR